MQFESLSACCFMIRIHSLRIQVLRGRLRTSISGNSACFRPKIMAELLSLKINPDILYSHMSQIVFNLWNYFMVRVFFN